MKIKSVLIITHGNFGIELLKSVEMIMGKQKYAIALGLNLGDDIETLRAEANKVVIENNKNNNETVILVDILGGSPSNIGLYMVKSYDVKLITGVNMLMLIELFSSRDTEELDDLIKKIIKSSIEGIKKFENK